MSDVARVASKAFFNREGELRCGWRIAVFVILFSLCISLLIAIADSFLFDTVDRLYGRTGDPSNPALVRPFLEQILSLSAVLIASAFCTRLLERRALSSLGYKIHTGWLRDSTLGCALGALALSLSVALAVLAGALAITRRNADVGDLIAGGFGLLLLFGISAAFEELLVRGFIFQALDYNIGAAAALAITSVAFGLLHLWNPQITAFSLANTMLAGFWLGVAYLKTRSLWLPTALHLSWNFSMAFIFGLPVSGITTFSQSGLFDGIPRSPFWISGGSYGPEGGAAASAALMLSTLIIWRTRLFRASNEMLAAIRHGSLKVVGDDLRTQNPPDK